AVGELLDQRLPRGIEGAGLRRERGLALEVHAGEVHDEVRVAGQQALHPGGRALARVSEDERRLAMRRERLVERGGRGVRQLEVDDDGQAAPGRDLEDLAECGMARVAIDV